MTGRRKNAAKSTDAAKAVGFRTRVAQVKRERMRSRLLIATMDACSAGTGTGTEAVIDDVVKAAGVSRGTFYKYFDSIEQAVSQLGSRLADETVSELILMVANVEDPLQRTAAGLQFMIARSIADPIWGRFVGHTEHLTRDSVLLAGIRQNTLAGQKKGDFQFKSMAAAVDFQLGLTKVGVTQVHEVEQGEKRGYMRNLAHMTLLGLGTEDTRATEAVQIAAKDLFLRGPKHLKWWKEFR